MDQRMDQWTNAWINEWTNGPNEWTRAHAGTGQAFKLVAREMTFRRLNLRLVRGKYVMFIGGERLKTDESSRLN